MPESYEVSQRLNRATSAGSLTTEGYRSLNWLLSTDEGVALLREVLGLPEPSLPVVETHREAATRILAENQIIPPEIAAEQMLIAVGISLPSIGSIWHWEPMISTASQRIKVVEIKWNGDEFWIGSVQANKLGWLTEVSWNEWGRFIEAAVCIEVPE